jgi:hypothetical protein
MNSKRANSGALNRGLWAHNKIYYTYWAFWVARGAGNFGIMNTRNFNASPNKVFRQLRRKGAPEAPKTRDLGAQRAHRNNNIPNQRNKIRMDRNKSAACTIHIDGGYCVPSSAGIARNFLSVRSEKVFAHFIPISNKNENERRMVQSTKEVQYSEALEGRKQGMEPTIVHYFCKSSYFLVGCLRSFLL